MQVVGREGPARPATPTWSAGAGTCAGTCGTRAAGGCPCADCSAAGGDDVLPGRAAAAAARDDVIEGQVRRRIPVAAILAEKPSRRNTLNRVKAGRRAAGCSPSARSRWGGASKGWANGPRARIRQDRDPVEENRLDRVLPGPERQREIGQRPKIRVQDQRGKMLSAVRQTLLLCARSATPGLRSSESPDIVRRRKPRRFIAERAGGRKRFCPLQNNASLAPAALGVVYLPFVAAGLNGHASGKPGAVCQPGVGGENGASEVSLPSRHSAAPDLRISATSSGKKHRGCWKAPVAYGEPGGIREIAAISASVSPPATISVWAKMRLQACQACARGLPRHRRSRWSAAAAAAGKSANGGSVARVAHCHYVQAGQALDRTDRPLQRVGALRPWIDPPHIALMQHVAEDERPLRRGVEAVMAERVPGRLDTSQIEPPVSIVSP